MLSQANTVILFIMNKEKLVDVTEKITKEQILAQIRFAKRERRGERELFLFDGIIGLLFLLGSALLIALQGIMNMDPILKILGTVFGFLLSGFFLFLSFGHFKKQKEKTIFIHKLQENVKD